MQGPWARNMLDAVGLELREQGGEEKRVVSER